MAVAEPAVSFAVGAVVSLGTSWLLVSRLERIGERLDFSEALLGMVAALAADAPEITASITALAHRQNAVGAGVTIGSNVFNLAALLGLGALVAGGIRLHRRVTALSGGTAVLIAVFCLLAVSQVVPVIGALALVLAVLVPLTAVLAAPRLCCDTFRLPAAWRSWLVRAINEEETELAEAIRPRRGRAPDAWVALGALAVVVAASIEMERGATSLGAHYRIAEIVTGGLVLAAVTSLPNAVAAVYLARRGRGAAALSTAMNSNALNVAVGLLLPAAIVGLGHRSTSGLLVAGWYLGLTGVTVALAYRYRGLPRAAGGVIVALYVLFVAAVLVWA
ncbi:MAG TPA: hypothetical protein VME70_07815 [Mycobacteriales bacterium]|nr:hypothetical protein [Mycobacteriales bacterium]